MAARRPNLLTDPVGPTLLSLAWPMLIGIASILLFNIVDTFWVGQIGPAELAAMSYTFPVVMVVMSITMGIGIGTTAVVGRALGNGDEGEVRRLTTHALLLANGIVVLVAMVGLLTIDPLFRALGADDSTLALIRTYMVPWYLGVGFLVIPMVGNSAIRATGDTKTPSYVMMVAGFVNAALDPLLIFGIGPFPELGLQGAALATIGSYLGALVAALYVLIRRERLVEFVLPTAATLLDSWRRILAIGMPAAATNLLTPVAAGLLTRMVSGFGATAVAAYGVGTRVEGLALIGVSALSTAVTPFVAQNLGAGRCDRIRAAVRFVSFAALGWGAAAALGLGLFATPIARVFSDAPEVIASTRAYLTLVPFSFGLFGIAALAGSVFNALGRPLRATVIVVVRLAVLALPLAWLGARLHGLPGLFGGIAAANVLVGLLGWWMVSRGVAQAEAAVAERASGGVPLPPRPASAGA